MTRDLTGSLNQVADNAISCETREPNSGRQLHAVLMVRKWRERSAAVPRVAVASVAVAAAV